MSKHHVRTRAAAAVVGLAALALLNVAPTAEAADEPDHVLAISVDGLNRTALTQLGRSQVPNFWRLLDEGNSTLNARTSVEKTITLPNHVGMVTGERVSATAGGHGVTINTDTTRTVHDFAGRYESSMFEVASDAGLDTAIYTGKSKFSIMPNSWPDDIDTYLLDTDLTGLMDATIAEVASDDTELIFLHIRNADEAGHRYGWMSAQYLTAVRTVDSELGRLLAAVDARPAVKDSLAIILTADHGGVPGTRKHNGVKDPQNYTIPFLAWGAGVTAGDLYATNSDYLDPGTGRPTYKPVRQPVRNIALGNLALDLLGLGPIPGSGINATQNLDVGP